MRVRLMWCVALFALPLFAEDARISGRVEFERDNPLPGVTVTITSATVTRRTTSDEFGLYVFEAVPPGRYELKAELTGLHDDVRMIDVDAGQNDRRPLQLSMGEAETITLACALRVVPNRRRSGTCPNAMSTASTTR